MGVNGSQENSEKKPVVLIIGGGYGGIQCAKSLDKIGQFFVILIDRNRISSIMSEHYVRQWNQILLGKFSCHTIDY